MEQELVRTCISLPSDLLDRFDEIIAKRDYSSRSEAIRDSIRNYIVKSMWMDEIEGEYVGIISFVYEHCQRGLVEELTETQHTHKDLITSSVHVHLNHDSCLELALLRGEGRNIKEVADALMALKGVRNVKLHTVSPSRSYS